MKLKSVLCSSATKLVAGSIIWVSSHSVANACGGEFYVVWAEAEASTQVYVRASVIDFFGNADRYGVMTVPDDALGNPNPSYIHSMLMHSLMNNTKLFITTDDIDCQITTNGENLGTINDVQSL